MPAFEYLFVEVNKGRVKTINGRAMPTREHAEVYTFSNTIGRGGWEIVGVVPESGSSYTLIFKHAGKGQRIERVQSAESQDEQEDGGDDSTGDILDLLPADDRKVPYHD